MSDTIAVPRSPTAVYDPARDTAGLGGQPRGLTTLFLTEMWERFSYYGMRAILVLYMVASPGEGGLGFDVKQAAGIYGTYAMSSFLLSLPGAVIADRLLGARLSVLLGGIIIASGHFTMALHSLTTFYLGLILIACGTGLLKPNVTTMVGRLYGLNDPRRDAGFSLFYMGINLGAFTAPLVCGYLAEGKAFQAFLQSMSIDPMDCWHFAFATAGIGMLCGLIVYWLQRGRLAHVGNRRPSEAAPAGPHRHRARNRAIYAGLAVLTVAGTGLAGPAWQSALTWLLAFDAIVAVLLLGFQENLSREDWRRMGAIVIFFLVTIAFWAAYDQKGVSLNLLIKNLVDRKVGDFEVPAAWFQSLTALYVILLAPLFAALWLRLGKRQPSSPMKFVIALAAIGAGYAAFAAICGNLGAGRISPSAIAALFLLEVIGELCISPVGLNTITRLAPLKLSGLMMGLWFFGTSFGYDLAGYLGGFYTPNPDRLLLLFGGIGAGLLASAAILWALLPFVRKLMGDDPVEASSHAH